MPLELDFAERRVLGVLLEKGYTTPEQYPLSLNAIVAGSNQKSCRDPMSSLDENSALDALESLRRKGLAVLVRIEGSRVDRWKHKVGEALSLEPKEISILAELLLRGAQTDGELRQRASRMVPLETLEEAASLLDKLMSRPEPLVRRATSREKKRGAKFDHTLYGASEKPQEREDLQEEEPGPPAEPAPERRAVAIPVASSAQAPPAPAALSGNGSGSGPAAESLEELKRRLAALEERVEELEATFVKFLR
jgi:uncharacterized protein YceH (UPF0502 family)